MPRKVFVSGEILTASDVNTQLMDQSVMVFDDATARATAIPTPVEGMVTYLKDTDRVDKFDGTNFVNVDTGGLVEVKSVARTEVFSAAVATGGVVDITTLSITHEVASTGNKVLLLCQIGVAGSNSSDRSPAVFFAEDGTALNIGDLVGSRPRASAGLTAAMVANQNGVGFGYHLSFLHTPSAGSKTYTVRALNISTSTQTLFINRSHNDRDDALGIRGSSTFTLMEVAV